MIHLVFELDDEARQLEQRVSRLGRGGPRAAARRRLAAAVARLRPLGVVKG